MKQNADDTSIDITKKDLSNFNNGKEVVYSATTMSDEPKLNDYQSLRPNERISGNSFYLYRAALIGDLLALNAGIGLSWTSPVLPKLHGPNSPLNTSIDTFQESLITSILCIGAAFGAFLFGHLADKIGRKKTLLTVAVPMVAGMPILAFTDQVRMYYLGRFLYGLGSGGVFTVLTMYTGEITEDHNRGKFSCIQGLFVSLGVLCSFSIGSVLCVRIFCLACLLPLQIFVIFFALYAPDSPSYLVRINRLEEAEAALRNLHLLSKGQAGEAIADLQRLEEIHKESKGGVKEIFRSTGLKRAFLISAVLLILEQFSGINAVIGFMENIFRASGDGIPPQAATTLVGVIQVATVFVTSSFIDKLGRKFLLLVSAIGSAASILVLGLYFFLHKHECRLLEYFWWLPISCLLLYIVSFNLGLGPVTWTVLCEVFPDNVKSTASSMVAAICFLSSFLVTFAFPVLSELLGMAESFWLFGLCCVLGIIFIHYVVVETKGKSAIEIQKILSENPSRRFCISWLVLPFVSGTKAMQNRNPATRTAEKVQKVPGIPSSSVANGKPIVTTNDNVKLKNVVEVAEIDFILAGNNSASTTQGRLARPRLKATINRMRLVMGSQLISST
ncbi:hypothetical protein HUJ04_007823 [Dendroctonus ponderosae]|nr:hypothetical protein HUJ04_007823 [Dendroctonus ponderosae]KAH1016636.1 hypothetical protein HUJ04_007823 [Dendroctonus ponderosae]